jgi:hypothetical protein
MSVHDRPATDAPAAPAPPPPQPPDRRQQWLIGPALYPTYVRLLRTLAMIVLPLVATGVVVGTSLAGEGVGRVLLAGVDAVMSAGVQLAFWTTLVFAILERSGWTPEPSSEVPATAVGPSRVGIGETAVGIAFQVLLIVVVLAPWRYRTTLGAETVPVLHQGLDRTVTATLVAVLVAGIAVAVAVYATGRWTVPLAAVNSVLDAALAGIVVWLVSTDRLFDPAFVEAVQTSATAAAGAVPDLVGWLATLIAWVVAVGCTLDAVDGWRKALRSR